VTRPFDKHLDSNELDTLVSLQETSASASAELSESDLREAQRHVESCQDCSRKLQRHQFVHSEILRMRMPNPSPPSRSCMGDAEWLEVAAGLLPEAKTRELMKHAAQCGHCGPLLKNAAEALIDEATPSEEALLASLQSVRPEWRKNMAATLRDGVRDEQPKSSWWKALFVWPAPAYAFGGIVLVAALAWIGMRAFHPPSAEQLLARAYTEHRTLEVRIPGATYAPMRTERGVGYSDFDKPTSLLKAKDLIGEALSKNPNDPKWLQARARAELLDGNYEGAIRSLHHALEIQPHSPSLLTDMGSAYFVRGESTNRPIDYGNAIEVFGEALARSPDDPIALFNRALACERMFLYNQAVDDWEHYLRIDSQGGWSEEARKRLAALQEKLQGHEKSQSEPLLTPAEVGRADNDPAIRAKVEGRIEEYLHIAVAEWLPNAYRETSAQELANEARTAVRVLGKIAETSHGDLWLSGLVSNTRNPSFPSAVLALASSVRAADKGDYSEQRISAHRASLLFHSTGNLAGELRAQAQEVYADHLLYEGPPCMSLVRRLMPELERGSFTWLQTEMALEEMNCAGLVGDMGTHQAALAMAISLAIKHQYLTLYLRGLGFESDRSASLGDATKAFSLASEGLRLFWSAPVQVMEGYNFYTDLDTAADNLRLPNLQVVLWKQATEVIDSSSDILQRAMAHRWYGNSAYLADRPLLAEQEFAKASALFAAAPPTAATLRDRMDAEIWQARIETRHGDVNRAGTRLEQAQPILDSAPSFVTEVNFYNTEAEVNMRRSDYSATESSLRSAVFLAEWALNSFTSEIERRQWAEQTQSTYRGLVAWTFRQRDATSALELWEWYKGALLRAKRHAISGSSKVFEISTPPDVHEAPVLPTPTRVSDQLPLLSGQTVIAYAAFPDGMAVWAYDDRGIMSRWIDRPLPQVLDLFIRFREICSDPSSDLLVLRETARSLYDLLIAPVEERVESGRVLVFEPDEALGNIPFEALVDRNGHYLAERNAIVISPGLYQTNELRPVTAVTSESPALVVSVPSPGESGWAALADAQREAETVAANFRSARLLKGSDASLAAIRQNLHAVSIFHFAGHAVSSPERDGLVLVDRDPHTQRARLLNAQSLPDGDIDRLQLAVLSACQTDTRPDASESGNEGLAKALLHGGVPHVITSRWNIDSSQTATLMKKFYSGLLSGGDAANSLRNAELALAAQLDSQHPYYWAAFELQGVQ
jgi:CHAT domain-containing protein/tetratricopeptide (TPR) repeat protein